MKRDSEQDAAMPWKRSHLNEPQVAAAWERRAFQGETLHTVDGQSLQVVFPGRKSGLRGPDFSDAIIAIGGSLHKGEVEIHVRSSDFARHGHTGDHHYNKLVLHVVLIHDTEESMLNGSVPIFEMGRLLEGLPDVSEDLPGSLLPCIDASDKMGTKRLLHHLEQAGEARFKLKAGRFMGDICYFGGEETLYQGVMEALGYSQNKSPFLNLARAVPSAVLRTVAAMPPKGPSRIQALLLWASSLEASMDKPPEADKYGVVQLHRKDWELSRVRPDNHPLSRIMGMAGLVARVYKEDRGLEEYFLRELGSAQAYSNLVKSLAVHDDGKTLVGPQRASEIVLNVVLPFAYAEAELKSDATLAQSALSIYRSAAKSSENHITGLMYQQFGLSRANLKTACQQQGLLHIYKERCQDLRCADCAIASALA